MEAGRQRAGGGTCVCAWCTPAACDSRCSANAAGGTILRLEQDVLVPLVRRQQEGEQVYCQEMTGFWSQLKHPGAAIPCTAMVLAHMRETGTEGLACSREGGPVIIGDVLVDASAVVDPSAKVSVRRYKHLHRVNPCVSMQIGPNVTIGRNVTIGAGVRVKNSILLDGVRVQVCACMRWRQEAPDCCIGKDRACIIQSVIGWDSSIGRWCRIEGDASSSLRASAVESTALTKAGGATVFGESPMWCG